MEELFALAEQTDERTRPDGLVVRDEIARREEWLARLAEARVMIVARGRVGAGRGGASGLRIVCLP